MLSPPPALISSPLGTAHAARFTHPLAIATAIFSAGALAATMIVALAVIPSVPVEEMMQACQDAQEGNGPWAMGVEMHGYPFPKAQMQHDGFAGDMGYPYSGQPDFVLPTEPEDGMMYALTDDMMYAYAVDSVEMSEQAMPMYHEAHHDHDDHHAHAEYQGYHHHEEHEYEHDHHEDAHHDMHHEGEEHKDHEEEEEEHERPQLYREMYFDPPPEEPQPASAEVPRRPIQTESPVMSRAWGARRLQEMAIDNCDEMVEYMNSYLPVILMVNMLVQGGCDAARPFPTKCAHDAHPLAPAEPSCVCGWDEGCGPTRSAALGECTCNTLAICGCQAELAPTALLSSALVSLRGPTRLASAVSVCASLCQQRHCVPGSTYADYADPLPAPPPASSSRPCRSPSAPASSSSRRASLEPRRSKRRVPRRLPHGGLFRSLCRPSERRRRTDGTRTGAPLYPCELAAWLLVRAAMKGARIRHGSSVPRTRRLHVAARVAAAAHRAPRRLRSRRVLSHSSLCLMRSLCVRCGVRTQSWTMECMPEGAARPARQKPLVCPSVRRSQRSVLCVVLSSCWRLAAWPLVPLCL